MILVNEHLIHLQQIFISKFCLLKQTHLQFELNYNIMVLRGDLGVVCSIG